MATPHKLHVPDGLEMPRMSRHSPCGSVNAVETGIGGLRWMIREGTSDWNSVVACSVEDEYRLRDYDLRGKVVFDIGAHVGGVSLLAARCGASVVVAVEPVPENAEIIRANAALNGIHVEVIEAAAGEPGGTVISYGWAGEGAYGEETATVHSFIGNTGLMHSGYVPEHVIEVPTVTLQDLVDRYGLPYLVKLDCEGGEWPLIEEPIAGQIPVLVGEYHGWRGSPKAGDVYFENNREEVRRRLSATHDLSFHGPDHSDAGHFLALLR